MGNGKRDNRKQFLLDKELADQLKAVAEYKDFSENEIVNRALSAYLKQFKNIKPLDVTKEVIK